jgi:diguanylate cyclase (GGDEF)-like protein
MGHALRLLIVDEQHRDAERAAYQLWRGGYPCTWQRVETEAEFRAELKFRPDLILADFALPHYNGFAALDLVANEAPDIPFIFLSGSSGESLAIQALDRGASDYVSKEDLTRLVPAVTRVLARAPAALQRETPAQYVPRLAAILRALSAIRTAALTTHRCAQFVEEICRIVHLTRQYDYCFVALLQSGSGVAHTVARRGAGAECGRAERFTVAGGEAEDGSVVGRVLRTGELLCCQDIDRYGGELAEHERSSAKPGSALVSLPLFCGSEAVGALTLGTASGTRISDPELLLLRELARQVSDTLRSFPDAVEIRRPVALDRLTGLQTRARFCEHLAQRLRHTSALNNMTVVVFDVEALDEINALHGRHFGDRLLQRVAERLQGCFGGSAGLAHFGAGTFAAVFAERRAVPEDATEDPGDDAFAQPFAIADRAVPVRVKRAVARYPSDGRDAAALVHRAEAILQELRERRRADPPADTHLAGRRERAFERRLRAALPQQEFSLYYQPLVERVSGQVIAVEALLRWCDPQHGLLAPRVFLPTLERTSLIVPVGEWVLSQAVRDLARWHAFGLPKLRVAVNVSAAELGRRDFANHFLARTRRAANTPYIDIEITESALQQESQRLRGTLKTLRGEGVRIAIDHFGMAHCALSRLCELPVDSLKIDRSFVSHLTDRPQSQAVVSAIIALARSYGLHTVAEGVENVEQLKILDDLGCEQSQGYLHSPAVSAEDLGLLVSTRSGVAVIQ